MIVELFVFFFFVTMVASLLLLLRRVRMRTQPGTTTPAPIDNPQDGAPN